MSTVLEGYVCSNCEKPPKTVTLKKNGEEKFPNRWKRTEDGVFCIKCTKLLELNDPCMNWSYDCQAPHVNLERVESQILLGHRYRNALVEVERKRRERTDEALRRHCPELLQVETELAALNASIDARQKEIRQQNAKVRKRTATPEQREQLRSDKATRKELRARRKALRANEFASSEAPALLADIEAWAKEEKKRRRRESGLFWGTSGAVDQTMRNIRKGAPPNFARWYGDGRMAVQVQGGLPVEKALLGKDTRVRVEVHEEKNRNGHLATAWIRVDSDERKPVWAKVKFRMHRPLPEGGKIKWVYLLRRRVATHIHWRLVFAISFAEERVREDAARSGTVGIDVGWRILPNGMLRVAAWVGSDGRQNVLKLSRELVQRWQRSQDIQSIRSMRFDEIKLQLLNWLSKNPHPDWLKEKAKTLASWKSQYRLAALVNYWLLNRCADDEAIFAALVDWRKRDRHHCDYQIYNLRKAVRQREEIYKTFASDMRRHYAEVAVENTNWREVMERLEVESNENDRAARRYCRVGAVGSLVEYLRQSVTTTVRVDPAYTTQRCHACSKVDGFDAKKELVHQCRYCGAVWDQDYNAARNLLAAAASGQVVDETTKGPRGS